MRQGKELIGATKPFAQEHRVRSWWVVGSTLAVLLILFGATLFDTSWWLRVPCGVLAALVLVRMFVIYHDYVHGSILQDSWLADSIFTVFGLLMLSPRSIWKHSHDYHHHHNGQYFGTNTGTFPLMTTDEYLKANRWQRLGYAAVRHPITMVLGYFTMFFYRMCIHELLTNPRQHLDAAAALLLQAALITLLAIFAPSAIIFTYLVPTLVAGALGTYLFYAQHTFPAARFQDREGWDYVAAALHSSSFLRMDPIMHWFTANIGYHHIHHLNSRIPFYRLPEAMAAIEELQSPGTTTLHPREIWRCLRLKLWDPESQRLITFRESKRRLLQGSAGYHHRPTPGAPEHGIQSRGAQETAVNG